MSVITLQGACNVRDLGGIVAAGGEKVVPGRVFRADSLSKLTGSDGEVLRDLGLRTVLDFRGEPEVALHGGDQLPDGVSGVALPVPAGDQGSFINAFGDLARQHELLGDGRAAAFMTRVNREFVARDDQRTQFARALAMMADGTRLPVLFHCTAGKDRTGWMAAILLTALGVPRSAVMADYLLTNEYMWPAFEAQLRPFADEGQIDLSLFEPLLIQDPAYLEAAFDEADARYGSFERFLTEGLSFDEVDLARLRASLLS